MDTEKRRVQFPNGRPDFDTQPSRCTSVTSPRVVTERWNDWVARGAMVVTRKEQAEDTPGVLFELLRATIRFAPALAAEVAIAEPRLHREQSFGKR
jgi:hypothetical protein